MEMSLFNAAANGDLRLVEYLIHHGFNINEEHPQLGGTALHWAAANDRLNIVKTLINNGANIEARDIKGHTGLHIAALEGHLDISKTLIINGADVDAKNENGHTGLHIAANKGHLDISKTLIINGADVDAKNEIGATAADFASQNGHTDIVKFLVNMMQDSGKLSGSSRSNELVSHLLIPAAREGRMATVQELITNLGADPNHRDLRSGLTSEEMAHLKGQSDVAWLLNKSTQGRNRPSGIRPEWEVCKSIYGFESIKEMQSGKDTTLIYDNNLNAGHFDLHYQDDEGMTHLHAAVKKNQLEVISLLLERGALATAVTHDGFTPHDLASRRGSREEAADKIKEHLEKFTKNELKSASEKSHYYSVLLSLILECVSLSSRHKDDDGQAEQERQKVLKKASWLLSLGVPLEPPGNYYTHALHLAITSNCKSILTLLLAAGSPLYATQNGLGPVEVAWLTPDVTTWIGVTVTRKSY